MKHRRTGLKSWPGATSAANTAEGSRLAFDTLSNSQPLIAQCIETNSCGESRLMPTIS